MRCERSAVGATHRTVGAAVTTPRHRIDALGQLLAVGDAAEPTALVAPLVVDVRAGPTIRKTYILSVGKRRVVVD